MPPEQNLRIPLYPLLCSVAMASDLVSPILGDHHRQVTFIAVTIGQVLGLAKGELQELAMAATVHDIGGLSLKHRLDSFEFEVREPWRHTVPGSVLLAGFPSFAGISHLVRFHHTPWQHGRGVEEEGEPVSRLSHLIHLADRIAVRIDAGREILCQKDGIIGAIAAMAGEAFVPEQVEAFCQAAAREIFWLDLTSPDIDEILEEQLPLDGLTLGPEELPDLAELFRRTVDFRSRFTATHSSGVAAVAAALAAKSGREPEYCARVRLAGLLHDIGKLVVPSETLNKHTPLTEADFAVIRKHPYYSAWILRNVSGLEEIGHWAALHHERLDGSGYPRRPPAAELPSGARLLAVADTFTALTEERPYRCSMSVSSTDKVMENMAAYHKLDHHHVALVHDHLDELDHLRRKAQEAADAEHRRFMAECLLLGPDLDPDDYCPAGPAAGAEEKRTA